MPLLPTEMLILSPLRVKSSHRNSSQKGPLEHELIYITSLHSRRKCVSIDRTGENRGGLNWVNSWRVCVLKRYTLFKYKKVTYPACLKYIRSLFKDKKALECVTLLLKWVGTAVRTVKTSWVHVLAKDFAITQIILNIYPGASRIKNNAAYRCIDRSEIPGWRVWPSTKLFRIIEG